MRDKEVAEAAAGQLTKAGIRTTLKTYEWGNYLNNMVYAHKAGPVWLIGWGAAHDGCGGDLRPALQPGSIFVELPQP